MIKKEAEKLLKYKDLIIEIQRMGDVRTEVIPVIIWATGTNRESLTHHLSNVRKSAKLRNYQKQPYWALHTNCGKC